MTIDKDTRARRGQGSVAWIESKGRYRISVPRRDRPNDPIREWSPGPQTPQAEQVAQDRRVAILAARNAGQVAVASGSGTVAEWLDEWIALQTGKDPKTIAEYRGRVDLYLVPTLGRYRLKTLKPADIARAYDRLRLPRGERPAPRDRRPSRVDYLSETSIRLAHKTLVAALNVAMRMDPPRILSNPAELISVGNDQPEIEPPTIDQVDAMLADLAERSDPMLAYYLAARWSGARQGELAGLRRSDVDPESHTLTFRRQVPTVADGRRRGLKAGRARSVVVPRFVIDAILAQPVHHRSPLAFHRPDGSPLTHNLGGGHFLRLTTRLDLRPSNGADLDHFRPHDLRHAFATMMREAGGMDALVAQAMGHASVTMLERYSHIVPRRGGRAYQLVVTSLGADDARDFYGIR
jgi:integrase